MRQLEFELPVPILSGIGCRKGFALAISIAQAKPF
jgi:hypothetical protein